jgi:Concanavalin A-like lectin/glucanases superfamily
VKHGWHHLVATKDGDHVAFYVDGQPAHEAGGARNSPTTMAWHVMRNGGFPQFTRGRADEIAVYNVALSANTVKAHFDAAQGGPGGIQARVP